MENFNIFLCKKQMKMCSVCLCSKAYKNNLKDQSVCLRVSCCEETPCPWHLLSKKTLNWDWLTVLRVSPLPSWREAWQHVGRQAGESSRSRSSGSVMLPTKPHIQSSNPGTHMVE